MKFCEHTYYLGALLGSALAAVAAYAGDPSDAFAIPCGAVVAWAGSWIWTRRKRA